MRDEWFELDDGQGRKVREWAEKVAGSSNSVKCVICNTVLAINSSKGFQSFTQHANSKGHKMKADVSLNPKQLKLTSGLTQSGTAFVQKTIAMFAPGDQATVAEIMWTLYSIAHNYSFSSCDGIIEVFNVMFPGKLLQGFSISKKKMRYLTTEALGPYFKDDLINDLSNANLFSVLFDETTNSANAKELEISVRFFSEKFERVVTRHLQTYFIAKADGASLAKCILKAVSDANLPLSDVLMVGCDGPNVNKTVLNIINEKILSIRDQKKSLINIGTCNIHIVHNAFKKGLEEFGEDCSNLAVAIHYYFKGWPGRWDDFQKVQEELKVPSHKFIKHVPSRWLTLENACERLLEQYSALLNYFRVFIPKNKPKDVTKGSYVRIKRYLCQSTMKSELHFVHSSAKLFSSFTAYFQKNEPLVHELYESLNALLQKLMNRFLKSKNVPSVPATVAGGSLEKLFEIENLLPLNDMCPNLQKDTEFKKLKEVDRAKFLLGTRKHYLAACKHIFKKSCLSQTIVKYLRCVGVIERKTTRSCDEILKIAECLPMNLDLDSLRDEWLMLQNESEPESSSKRIDLYWCHFFKKTVNNVPKYPTVTRVVKAVLSLVHGSADVERRFSESSNVLTEARASMHERTLDSLLTIKDTINLYDKKVHTINVPQKLINLARHAAQSYNNYLAEEKAKKEAQDEDENEKKAEKEALQKKTVTLQQEIESKKKKVSEKKKEETMKRAASDKLFQDANKKLKEALRKKDLTEIQIAQAMLESCSNLRREETSLKKEIEEASKKIDSRKDQLTKYYKKNMSK